MPVVRTLGWVLLVGLFAFALGTYDLLPDSIPTGIDANGNPRGMRDKAIWAWLAVPGIALLIQLMLVGIRAALPTRPQLFNFPGKDRFLQLPQRYRAPVLEAMRATLDLCGLVGQLPLLLVQWMLWQSARGQGGSASLVLVLLAGVFTGPVILIAVGRVSTATDEAVRRWQADGSPSA